MRTDQQNRDTEPAEAPERRCPPEEDVPLAERPLDGHGRRLVHVLERAHEVLQHELAVVHRLVLDATQLLERRQQAVAHVERLEAHAVRVAARHQVHRLQNLREEAQ